MKDDKECCQGARTCPKCGKPGCQVPETAVQNLLREGIRKKLAGGDYYICINPVCDVVYYNPLTGESFAKDLVKVKVWLKDPADDVPLCYCNKITRKQIRDAWLKGAQNYTEVLDITGAANGKCNCKYENPSGRCCSGVINEYLGDLRKAKEKSQAKSTIGLPDNLKNFFTTKQRKQNNQIQAEGCCHSDVNSAPC